MKRRVWYGRDTHEQDAFFSRSSPLGLTKASHQIITSAGRTQLVALVVKKSVRLGDFVHNGGEGDQRRKVRISSVKPKLSERGL